jgi:hypothetical protein
MQVERPRPVRPASLSVSCDPLMSANIRRKSGVLALVVVITAAAALLGLVRSCVVRW